jgi:hypothetical protein
MKVSKELGRHSVTERSRTFIAVAVVILVVAIPAIVLAFRAMALGPWSAAAGPASASLPASSGGANPPTAADGIDPVASPPSGFNGQSSSNGGYSRPDNLPAGNVSDGDTRADSPAGIGDTHESPTDSNAAQSIARAPSAAAVASAAGGGSVNIDEGTLKFYFSAAAYDALPAETLSLLDAFLGSPKNKQNIEIAVSAPQIAAEDETKLMTILKNALQIRGFSPNRLTRVINAGAQPVEPGGYFEVNMSYITPRTGK